MERILKTLKPVYAKKITTKDGKSFIRCLTKVNNTYYNVKFTQDSDNSIRKVGVYEIIVPLKGMSIQEAKPISTGFKPNDTLWIRECDEIRQYSQDELNELEYKRVSDIFND